MDSSHSIPRRLFSLAAPIIGLNVLNVLALAVDTAMCGRLDEAELSLTALGFAVQLVFLLLVAMMGLTVGTVAMISRAHGAADSERANHVMAQSATLTVILGIGVAIVGNLAAPYLLQALGARGDVVDEGLRYLRPLLAGTVFYYLTILCGSVMRGVGNTRVPFFVALLTNVVNFVANYALILGNFGFPELGIQGAAFGTVLSQAVGATLLITILHRGQVADLRLPLRFTRIDGATARSLIRVGWPAALDMVILNAAFLSIIGMLGRISEDAVAAHGIGLRIQALAFVPGLGISQATGAMVGQALGAGSREDARAVVRASMAMCVAIMSTLAITVVFLAFPIVGIFDVSAGTDLEGYAVTWMRLLGYGMPIAGLHIALVGMLQGSGKTFTSLRINVVGTLLFQIPMSYVLGFTFDLGALGVWLGFPLSFPIRAGLAYIVFRGDSWATLGVDA